MKKHVILIAVIVLVCACAVGLVALAMNSDEPNEGASDAGEVSDIVTDPTDEITEPITDKPTEPVTEPATEAPTEPVTEAPTEPETEPDTVPPTQPKVDFTYIARDTMLDGEQVEYHDSLDHAKYFNRTSLVMKSVLFHEVNAKISNATDNDQISGKTFNMNVITTFDEYEQLCRDYYNDINSRSLSERTLNDEGYKDLPEYSLYDSEYFRDNDLIVLYSERRDSFVDFKKSGAELSIKGIVVVRQKGLIYDCSIENKTIKCFEIDKASMDGVDTISLFIEKIY